MTHETILNGQPLPQPIQRMPLRKKLLGIYALIAIPLGIIGSIAYVIITHSQDGTITTETCFVTSTHGSLDILNSGSKPATRHPAFNIESTPLNGSDDKCGMIYVYDRDLRPEIHANYIYEFTVEVRNGGQRTITAFKDVRE